MDTNRRTREELIGEIEALEKKVSSLENIESVYKHTEQELRIKEESIASCINAIAFSDVEGNLIYTNASFLRMWGYDSGEAVLGRPVVDFWQTDKDVLGVMQVLRDKGSWVGELSAKRKDGSVIEVQLSANMVKDREDRPICMMGSFIDITDYKNAEKALKKSEERWRSLAKNAPNIIIVVDRDGTIEFINYTVPGFTVEETIGTKVYDYIEREYYDKVRETIEQVFLTGKAGSYVIRGSGPHRTSWYETQAGPIEHNGQVVAVSLFTTDITERKDIEEALRQSEQKYRLIAENTSDYIAVMEFSGIYTYISPSHRQLGYEPEDLVGKSGFDMVHPEDKLNLLPLLKGYAMAEFAELFKKKAKNVYERVEFRFPDKKGNWRDMEATANLMESVPGKKYDILIISRDVTKRKKTEAELREQSALADRANKELKRKVEELEEAMRCIKKLEGLVPLCVNCKKMRLEGGDPDDPASWVPLEKYISERTNASLTHGLCPDCIKKIYGKERKEK
jgi:PAS domain S-box-containing protein